MERFAQELIDRLTELHQDAAAALAGLPQEATDWAPGPDIPSLAILVAHMAGSQRYWIGEMAGGDPANRIRDLEFETRGLDADALQHRLEDVLAHGRRVLESLSPDDLNTVRRTAGGEDRSALWSILHALEHTAIHVGHMQIVRQLWDQRGAS